MGILTKLVWILLNLICIGIDITVFYVIVKIVLNRWTVNWLKPFEVAGERLAESYTGFIKKFWNKICLRPLTPQEGLVVGLTILIIVRLLIMAIAGIL